MTSTFHAKYLGRWPGTLAVWLCARVDTTQSLLTYKPLRNGCRSYRCVPSSSDSRGVWNDISGLFCASPPVAQCKCIIWRLDRILRIHSLQLLSCCRCQESSAPVGVEVGLSTGCLHSPRDVVAAFHSERFKSQRKEDALSFRIWPLSPTWLLLLNFIFLKRISKFFTHSREAKLDSRRSPQ